MPLYEYCCRDCGVLFEELRPMADADTLISCAACHSKQTFRKISRFAAHSGGRVVAGGSANCSSCSTHQCSSCSSLN